MHFPMKYSLEYFRQLTSEEKVIRWTGGQPRVIFQKKKESGTGGRNEPLDCRVYALSALRSLPINLRTLARKRLAMKKRSEETKSTDETPEKSPDTPENQPKTPKKVPIRRPRRPKRAGWLSAR
jgi:phage terminase large subunit GpA-like protein